MEQLRDRNLCYCIMQHWHILIFHCQLCIVFCVNNTNQTFFFWKKYRNWSSFMAMWHFCINILSSSHGPISFVETPSNVHIITLKNVGDRQLPSILLCTSSIHQSNWFLACKFLNKEPLSFVEFFKLTVDQTFLTSFISLSLTQSTNYFKLTHPKP